MGGAGHPGASDPAHHDAAAAVARDRPRTERVTTTALASRTRADTDAGLGTVDDVGLANRQEHNATPVALAADPAGRRRPLLAAQSRARVVAEEMPVQQRRQVSSTIAEPARP